MDIDGMNKISIICKDTERFLHCRCLHESCAGFGVFLIFFASSVSFLHKNVDNNINIGMFFLIQQQFWAVQDGNFRNRYPRENPIKRMPKYYVIPRSCKASS